jgi:hypothetical protein
MRPVPRVISEASRRSVEILTDALPSKKAPPLSPAIPSFNKNHLTDSMGILSIAQNSPDPDAGTPIIDSPMDAAMAT